MTKCAILNSKFIFQIFFIDPTDEEKAEIASLRQYRLQRIHTRNKRQINKEKEHLIAKYVIYGKRMNSTEAAEHWRDNYTWNAVKIAQFFCHDSLKYFGYKFYKDDKEWEKVGRRLCFYLNYFVLQRV